MRSRFLSATAARERTFVNRDAELALFRTRLASQTREDACVLNFYGVGGIGKSRLMTQLEELITTEDLALAARIDLQLPSARRQDAAICCLRQLLHKQHRIDFARFDIAYAVYWQRSNPHLPLSEKNLPFINESEVLGNVVSAASDVPVFGVAVGILKLLDRARRGASNWHRLRQDPHLQNLDSLEPEALLDSLTFFFSSDLVAGLRERKAHGAILVDAHEALWEDVATTGGLQQRDAWLRDLAYQCPGVMVVVNSRDELPWKQYDDFWTSKERLISRRLDDLAPEHRTTFLEASGVGDPSLVAVIANASRGVPFYLHLAVDVLAAAPPDRLLSLADFGDTADTIVGRFVSHVPRAEEELLKVLSVPRFWNPRLGGSLARHFNIGFALSRWAEFSQYSFIIKKGDNYHFHALMREAMLDALNDDLTAEVHYHTYQFYRLQYSSSKSLSERFDAYREAAFHLTQCNKIDIEWLGNAAHHLFEAGYAQPMRDVVAEMRRNVEQCQHPANLLTLLQFLEALVNRWAGRVQEARDELMGLDVDRLPSFKARITLELAHACREAGDTTTAANTYRTLRTADFSDADSVRAMAGVWEGDILLVQGKFAAAHQILDEARSHAEHEKLDLVAGEAGRLLGHVYRFSGRTEQALEWYDFADAKFHQVGSLPGIGEIATNRVELWALSNPDRAMRCGDYAISTNQRVNRLLEIGKCKTAIGQALLVRGRASAALSTFNEALQLLEEIGYQSGRARALLSRAFAYAQLDDHHAATRDIDQAVRQLCKADVYPTLVMQASLLVDVLGAELPTTRAAATKAKDEVQPLTNGADLERHLSSTVTALLASGRCTP